MQLKARNVIDASVLEHREVKDGAIVEITTKIEDVVFEGLELVKLSKTELQCQELQTPFSDGDDLFVIAKATFIDDKIQVGDAFYTIKESALEEFVSRLIRNTAK